ncbi:MAG: hypothetical protein OER88_00680 [Planctomycetota bacterium]|nr:hypothetical protein [Planctomycetota bacterium]
MRLSLAVLLSLATVLPAEDELADVRAALAKRRYERARALLAPACKKRNRDAMRMLGEMCHNGVGGPRDGDAAERWLRFAIEYGDLAAEKTLWKLRETPWAAAVVEEGREAMLQGDPLAAIRLWRRAADEGLSRDAALALGAIFGGKEFHSLAESVRAYRRAAYGGRLRAVFDAGQRHMHDDPSLAATVISLALTEARAKKSVLPPEQEVLDAWTARAQGGDLDALASLGMLYVVGGQADRGLLYVWQAAERGHVGAAGALYGEFVGTRIGPPDPEASEHWMRIAAERGHADSLAAAGMKLAQSDRAKAVPTLRRAAERGSGVARYVMGMCHWQEGWGVERDAVRAVAYLDVGVEQREPFAMFLLGVFRIKGFGGKEDPAAGWALVAHAAGLGNKPSLDAIRRGAKEGRPHAVFQLARLRIRGHRVPRNQDDGLNTIRTVAAAGCEPARAWLKRWGP